MVRVPSHVRFWRNVDTRGPDECWPWLWSVNQWGYGNASIAGRPKPAHRVAWELTNGPIPAGMCVLHRCDNPPCCNPAHLWLGTKKDNMRDMLRKGRARPKYGSAHPRAKLNEQQVRAIRELYASGNSTNRLAHVFGISQRAVYDIVSRAAWKHVL